jgi:hypothetical protein
MTVYLVQVQDSLLEMTSNEIFTSGGKAFQRFTDLLSEHREYAQEIQEVFHESPFEAQYYDGQCVKKISLEQITTKK